MTKKKPGVTFQSEEARKPGLLAAALESDGALDGRLREQTLEDLAKLRMLCQHFGIEYMPGNEGYWCYSLALALARELYPEPKKRGPKNKWTDLVKMMLVVEVERRARPNNPSKGVAWACSQLATLKPWKTFLKAKESEKSSPDPAEALRKVYYGFRKNRWAAISRDSYAYHKLHDALAEWDATVIDIVNNPDPK